MHVEHRTMGLEVDSTGVEQDALADQRYVGACATLAPWRPVFQVRDAAAALIVAGGHRQKRVGTQATQRPAIEPAHGQAVLAGERSDRAPVAGGVPPVWWQGGEAASGGRAARRRR